MLLEDEGGSGALFFLFIIGNVAMALTGLATIAAGSYVLDSIGHFDWVSCAFIIFGVGLLFMSVLAFWSRRDANMLLLYILSTAVLLSLQVAFTYAAVVDGSYDHFVGDNASQLRYVLIGCCVLIFLCLLVGWWYRASLQSVLNAQKLDEQLRTGLQKVTQAGRAPLL